MRARHHCRYQSAEKLYKAYLGELKGQMTSTTKEPKLHVVAGCLKGITALMVNFTKSVEDVYVRFSFEAFTENMAGETDQLELRRRYHCAAYNCAIALISRSFNETKFYQGFLFTERPDKVPIEKKKKHVMIWKEVSGENRDAPVYLSSQSYMADSSLSEEMSQFDFSTGVQSFSYNSQSPSDEGSSSRNRRRIILVLPLDGTVELEMDELNQHECMASMTALLRHMQRNNITPRAEEETLPTQCAGMRLLSCVDIHVDFKVVISIETLSTLLADERALSCVNPHVAIKTFFLTKTFSTLLAGERAFYSVDFKVSRFYFMSL
ncbi:DNA-dependent protein kinase catalytic subunit [Anabarilius grahami]|uniref:DNA-dependent protein kinase catalytic subunit n=1 Tax=Anabarilius grahami TaxID=495550 RepID=A0A3N0XTQ5_ANAGA|nr:DNA-dependent protein kinase catalytic subunit [Anabarilius grahami]